MGKRHFKVLLPETSFWLFLVRFWGADLKRMSPSAGFHFFALDTPIMSSVRPKIGYIRLDTSDWIYPIGYIQLDISYWIYHIGYIQLDISNLMYPIGYIQLDTNWMYPIGYIQVLLVQSS